MPGAGAGMTDPANWFERDPLWFKKAVFYEIHLRGFYDGNDDGSGDFRGLTDKLDYLQWLGVDCLWLLPFVPEPAARRRLRHRRLLRHPSRLRRRRGLHVLRRPGASARHARDRRSRHEPHVVRPPVVPGEPHRPAAARTATGTSGATTTRAGARRASSSSTPSRRTGRGTRCAGSTTGTGSSSTSRT